MMPRLISLAVWLQSQTDGVTFVELSDGEPKPTLAWVILSTFALIGIALLITIGIGAGTGLLRIWIRRRFPNNQLNGADAEPLVFLHLNEHQPHDAADPVSR
jgi:hypothetical protein